MLVDDEQGVYAVADGMGGHAAGDVASRLAIHTVRELIADNDATIALVASDPSQAAKLVALAECAVLEACEAIFERATRDSILAGMGCTLTLLLVAGSTAAMAHVGDSRLYMLRGGGCHQLSVDHTYANEMVRAGMMSAEQARRGPYAHALTRSLGPQAIVRVDTLEIALAPGDQFVLCSDGFSNYVESADQLKRLLPEELTDAPERLVSHAIEGGGDDNVTVVAVQVYPRDAPVPQRVARRRDDIGSLAQTALFTNLPLRARARYLSCGTVVAPTRGETLIRRGQQLDSLYICLDGTLVVRDGERTTKTIEVGGMLGHTALFHPRPARSRVDALEPCRVLIIDRPRLMTIVRRHPRLGQHILERLLVEVSAGGDSA